VPRDGRSILISISYDRKFGRTAEQAMAVADGARLISRACAELIAVGGGATPWERLDASEAIVAAGFANSASQSGDKPNTG